MRIAVCIKQVPEVSEIRFDNETRRLVREGVTNVVNPFDRRAVTQAVLLRERFGGEVSVLTMGPPQAREALLECLAVGADRAVHLCDPAFAGSDTLATARALALAVRRLGFDIVLCGRNSVDAETGQVGPEVAELLDIPHVSGLCEMEVSDDAARVVARRETDDGFQTLAVPLPCLLTTAERLVRPLRATPEDLEAAKAKSIETWTAADLSDDRSLIGQAGSPTSVAEIRYHEPQRDRIVVSGDDPQSAVRQLIDYLLSRGVFSPRTEPAPAAAHPGGRRGGAPERAVWVVAETSSDRLRPVTLELLGRGAEIAAALGGPLNAVLIGDGVGHHVPTLAAHGADAVLLAEDPSLAHYTAEAWTGVLAAALEAHRPHTVLIPSTAQGRDFAPRLAARLGLGLTGDCIGLETDAQGRLVQMKPAFGGNIVAPILSRTFPQMATVRPGMLSARPPDPTRRARVVPIRAAVASLRVRVLSEELDPEASDSSLESAEAVVCAGIGIGGPENLPPLRALADALGGALGASRRVVDNGWLPRQLQVGLTGKAIAPRLYVGVGVRGAFNHMVGIQKAEAIVAINSDPAAEVFRGADFGIVGDFARVVPVLTEAVREARRRTPAAK